MTEPLIELRGVSKAFGPHLILDEVDLTINHGDTLAIVGPSGTGKSTILRIMSGLLAPDKGEVYIKGEKRLGWGDDLADPITISLVFQNSALFDSLTVEENIGFYLYQHSHLSHSQIQALVAEKLAMVGLSNIGDRYPSQLSGGMRKRVSFARAIMTNPENPQDNPEVLLYDEPTAGLDPIASTVIEDLVKHLQVVEGGCNTYVIVTHQHSTIKRTAERIILLYQGKVQWAGNTIDIDQVSSPIVQQFFAGRVEGPIQVLG